MKIRFASALLALSLPLFAQDPAAQAEVLFYKAFYLEKSPKDFAQAMTLYEQFLAAAPDHKLASEAAKQQFGLLDRTGKTKERDAFKEKYGKLLGNVVATGAGDAPAAGDRPGRGAGAGGGERPARGEGGGAGRMDPAAQAARLAEAEKNLEKAKAEGNAEEVTRLTAQIERMKAGGGRGQGGPGGGAGGRGMGGGLLGTKKLAEMTAEEMTTFKESLGNMDAMVERMRERMTEEQAKGVDTNLPALKKALADNKLEDAQKALDALRASMPTQRRRGGGGGEGAGAGAGGGTPPAGGGRGGNNGGGGGTNRGGGGGR